MPPMPDPGHWRSCYSPGGTAARGRRQSCGGGASFRMGPLRNACVRLPATGRCACAGAAAMPALASESRPDRGRRPRMPASGGRGHAPLYGAKRVPRRGRRHRRPGSSRPRRRPCPLSACTCRWRRTFLPDRLDRAEIRGAGRPVKPNVTSKAAFFCRIGGCTD